MLKLANPTPLFLDVRGGLLDGGMIYVGQAGGDPEVLPLDAFWDEGLSIPASQPLRTIGGMIVNGTTPASVFIAQDDYAMRVTDNVGALVFYSPSIYSNADSYQPRDEDLTAIAALTTTPFGRNLLTLADQQALKTATGIPTPLPLAGGTVTGAIKRKGSGAYFYGASGLTSCKITIDPVGTADSTSGPGDVQVFY